jgi:hypothetical protein
MPLDVLTCCCAASSKVWPAEQGTRVVGQARRRSATVGASDGFTPPGCMGCTCSEPGTRMLLQGHAWDQGALVAALPRGWHGVQVVGRPCSDARAV